MRLQAGAACTPWVTGGISVSPMTGQPRCNLAEAQLPRRPVRPHGLRRSFKSLTEWLDIPAGVVAQLMGHQPSATAGPHYTVRPLDQQRAHHQRIAAWMLEPAGVTVDAAAPAGLRVVSAAGQP